MNLKRRTFFKRLAMGSTGLFLNNTSIANILSSPEIKKEDVVFPFLKYIKLYDFGNYFPKDQGGKFIQTQIFNSEDDVVIVKAIRNGILQKVYGTPINWGKLEKTELEKSVWLNRFYYLPSFARLYYLSGDKNYIVDMMVFIRQWINDNPKNSENSISKYNWYDMQVAWRSIHLSWCYCLCKNDLTINEKRLIVNSLKEHAEILVEDFGKQKLNEFNHQSHGALAMLYLGILFPEIPQRSKLIDIAVKILGHHIQYAFYADGGNVEQMFGYYPFETAIFRDAFLLCQANEITPPQGIKRLLRKMDNYLSQIAQPDGTMPQINDSFPMPVATTLATLNDILKNTCERQNPTSQFFPETQIGVIRDGEKNNKEWYALANPASTIGAHSHAGRLGFNLWYNKQPLVIDSGCCNYDDPLLIHWYRTSRAHNTVIIDGKNDEATSSSLQWAGKRQTENRITDFIIKPTYSYCRMESPLSETTNSSVKWVRCISIVKNKYTIIYDYFESFYEHDYEILFHLPHFDVEINDTKKRIQVNAAIPFALIPGDISKYKVSMDKGYIFLNGQNTLAPIISYHTTGSNIQSAIIIAPTIENISEIKIKQEVANNGLGLSIENESGEKDIIIFRKDTSESVNLLGRNSEELISVF